MKNSSWWLLAVFLLLTACEDAEDIYSRRSVSFSFAPSTKVPMLHSALNSLGEFVTIRVGVSGAELLFSAYGRDDFPCAMTEIDRRTTRIGLSGFIVGTPTMPELGQSMSRPVCYELTCINCYMSDHITRDVKLEAMGRAACPRCGRVYDLNNYGIIVSDTTGVKLDRYHISYSGGVTNSVNIY